MKKIALEFTEEQIKNLLEKGELTISRSDVEGFIEKNKVWKNGDKMYTVDLTWNTAMNAINIYSEEDIYCKNATKLNLAFHTEKEVIDELLRLESRKRNYIPENHDMFVYWNFVKKTPLRSSWSEVNNFFCILLLACGNVFPDTTEGFKDCEEYGEKYGQSYLNLIKKSL
jgi:hypothetical protein